MKHLNRALILFALIMVLYGCGQQKTKETSFNKYGIAFTCPANWAVTDTTEYKGGGSYIAVEKQGANSSGVVTFGIANVEYGSLEDYFANYEESLNANNRLGNIQFGKTFETNYGQYKGIAKPYTFSVLSLPHEGQLYAFSKNGKTVCVIEQGAIEDSQKNKDGFKLIEESFIIK